MARILCSGSVIFETCALRSAGISDGWAGCTGSTSPRSIGFAFSKTVSRLRSAFIFRRVISTIASRSGSRLGSMCDAFPFVLRPAINRIFLQSETAARISCHIHPSCRARDSSPWTASDHISLEQITEMGKMRRHAGVSTIASKIPIYCESRDWMVETPRKT